MEALILVIIIAWASRHAWNDTKAGAAKSRKAYMKRAAKKYPHMTSRQAARHAWRHDLGHALSQLLHGFPAARHGFAAGWNEGRQAHAQTRAEREKAKADYLETRAKLMPEIREHIRRQREAQEEIRRQRQGEGSEGSTSPEPGTVIQGSAEEVPHPRLCWSCFVPDGKEHTAWCATRRPVWPDDTDDPTYSWGIEGASHHWPAANREQAERQAQAASRDGRTHVVLEYPPGGGQGMIVAAFRDDKPFGRTADDDWHAPLPGEDGYGTTGNPPPDCWLCGLPVVGDELGASAHQRCVDVNDRDMQRTEIRDDRDSESVESDLFAQGKCSEQVEYGNGRSPAYCGQDVARDGASLCPQHEAEAMGEYDRAAGEIHRRTRELLANEAATSTPDSQQASGSPQEGTTSMSDATYASVTRDMAAAVASADNRAAEVNAAMAAAEAQAQEVGEAKTRATTTGDQMQALDMDPATLGAIADYIDALDEAEKAHQHAQEAYEAARGTAIRVQETAQNVADTLVAQQGQLAEAHANTQHSAANEFFQD